MPDENPQQDAPNPREASPDAPLFRPRQANGGNAQRPIEQFHQRNQQAEEGFGRRMQEAQAGTPSARPVGRGPVNAAQPPASSPPINNAITNSVPASGGQINQGQNIYHVSQVIHIRENYSGVGQGGRLIGMQGVLQPSNDPSLQGYESINAASLNPTVLDDDVVANVRKSRPKLPETSEEIRQWYRQLNSLEKCFVQAAAILSGAPEHEVKKATRALYQPIQEAEERRFAMMNRMRADDVPYFSSTNASIILEPQFLAKTYTFIRQTGRVRRLFWQDATANGFSAFAIQVIKIIEEESPIGGPIAQDFLEQLEQLPHVLGGESAWRVPHTLGSLWLNADAEQLRQVANTWVRSGDSGGFNDGRIANLLDGAYEIEFTELGEQATQINKSIVLSLLDGWIFEAHSSSEPQATEIGCAVAETYRVIGQRSLQPALRGLDSLLSYFLSASGEQANIPDTVFKNIIVAYFTLARFGALRDVMRHIAMNVERFSRNRQDRAMRDGRAYLGHRSTLLNAMLNSFLLLAAVSLSDSKEITTGMYSRTQSLVARPIIPNEQGKDIILVSILSTKEVSLRRDCITLLTGMLIEADTTTELESAFYILREWAETVLRERGPEWLDLRTAYVQFIVDVINKANEWGDFLRQAGYRIRSITNPCKIILQSWKNESKKAAQPQPIGAFANDVLKRLGS